MDRSFDSTGLDQVISLNTPKGVRHIGPGHPVFVIGEMSGNHNFSFERALKLIDIAADAGVDAIKMQTYTADTITLNCDSDLFQIKVNDAWSGQTLHSLYQKAYTPWDWQPKLIEYAKRKGLLLFSTPFDETAVDFLESLHTPIYKIASFESTHIPLLKKVGQTGKPVILSRGLTSLTDLETAIHTLKAAGAPQVAVLHCVSSYPASPAQMNLRTIPDIAKRFGVISGLSDHSLGLVAPVASVALGASIIEKHYTTCRADGGPDAAFSLEADELKDLMQSVRSAEACLGAATYEFGSGELENIVFRRSIFVTEDLKKGDKLSIDKVRVIRPGHGLAPRYFDDVIGKTANQDIKRGTPMSWDLLSS